MSDDNLPTRVPTSIPLSPSANLDLSGLSEEKRQELLASYANGMIDISKKAQELHVDVGALKATLSTLTDTTRQVSQEGNSVTVTHTHTGAAGRTEVIMGNTDNARRGKLSASQTGQRDWNPIFVLAGIIALVFIAFAFAS
jgi:hypothetical protein